MSLSEEIESLLAGFNVPAEISRRIGEALARIDDAGIAPGLETGEHAPNFSLIDSRGERLTLYEELTRGPTVVTFFRGAWCPICNLQVVALHREAPRIRAAGGSLIGIHPDNASVGGPPPEGFRLALDADQSVIREWRLQFRLPPEVQKIYLGALDTDLSQLNADGSWDLPAPGTFVIDQRGIVRRRHVTADYTRRMEPEEAIEALEEIGREAAATGFLEERVQPPKA